MPKRTTSIDGQSSFNPSKTFVSYLFAKSNRGLLLDIVVLIGNIFLIRYLTSLYIGVFNEVSAENPLAMLSLGLTFLAMWILPAAGAVLKRWNFHRRLSAQGKKVGLDDHKIAQLKRYRLRMKLHPVAHAATWSAKPIRATGKGTILVVSAGTSDIPVAEEAVVTATMMGNKVERLFDVGVAGIHRLLGNRAKLDAASVLIVVAGMEGALPSVVAGLVAKPVIAVPTSVGYGASFQGLSALLGMLNSCAAGVTVVNIDNGFGAGFAASLINRL